MTNENIPTMQEWGDISDNVDNRFSMKLYIGRSNDQMMERFKEAPIEVSSELQFMPKIPFQYYVLGFADAVAAVENDSEVNSEAASCFMRLIRYRSSQVASDVRPIYEKIEALLGYLVANQSNFGADADIYGDFQSIFIDIKSNLAS